MGGQGAERITHQGRHSKGLALPLSRHCPTVIISLRWFYFLFLLSPAALSPGIDGLEGKHWPQGNGVRCERSESAFSLIYDFDFLSF